ncbi:hypothetical protein SLE2022_350220 [Rubroshorea leprosula]
MQVENLSLPAIEEFLESGYQVEEYQTTKMVTSPLFGMPSITAGSSMLDYVAMPNSSRLSVISETSTQQTQERDFYQGPSVSSASLSQQEKQQQQQPPQQHNLINHSLMVPLPVASEQEQDSGLQMLHLLHACAEAVSKEDNMLARK